MAKYKSLHRRGGKNVFVYRDSKGRFVKFDPDEVYQSTKEAYIYDLTRLGEDAIHYAYEMGNTSKPKRYEYDEEGNRHPIPDGKWRNITFNLHDSIGSAVFEGGKVREESIRFLGEEKSQTNDRRLGIKGRDVLLDYFHSATYGKSKDEIVLVCMAAMYYTKYLEKGTHIGGYQIRVISYATDYIERNWDSYINEKAKHIVLKGLRLPDWARSDSWEGDI